MIVIPGEAAALQTLFSDLCHSAAEHAYGAEFGPFLNVHKIRVDSDNKR